MQGLTVREALKKASSFLSSRRVENSAFLGEYFIRAFLGWDRTRFLLSLSEPLPAEAWDGIEEWLERCAAGEPVQYITGEQEFYGEPFRVCPGVLIPRPETEILVEQVLRESDRIWGKRQRVRAADLGTGSGAIAVTLAKQRPYWEVWAVDLSPIALAVARENAERLGVAERIRFVEGDMLTASRFLPPPFELVVSNPPYIPSAEIERLEVQVKDYEPRMALDGGEDGLRFYRGIAGQLPELLSSPGLAAFEVGKGQSGEVMRILKESGTRETRAVRDYRGIERVVLGIY